MTAVDELTALLAAYDKREATRVTEAGEQQIRDASKSDVFTAVCGTVIRPVMVEIGDQLRAHGHTYAIREQEYQAHASNGGRQDARITMEVLPSQFPKEQYGSGSTPWLSFVQTSPQLQMSLYRSMIMPGRAGGNGYVRDYSIDELTTESVQSALMDWLTLILG